MGHGKESEKELKIAIFFSLAIFIVEFIGAIVSNSLALFSDATHVLSDSLALILSFIALRLAAIPPTSKRTFGFHRLEIFAALINGLILVGISLFIFYHAYERFLDPPEVKTTEMLAVALLGLVINLYVMLRLKGHAHDDLNIRSAFLHVVGDTLASLGVIIGALVIIFTGLRVVDPAIGVVIGVIIIIGGLRVIRESLHILLEGTPRHINLKTLKMELKKVDGVIDVHDVHVWSICSHIVAASGHVVVEDRTMSQVDEISRNLRKKAKDMGVTHATFQTECQGAICTSD